MRLYESHLSPFDHQDYWIDQTLDKEYWAYFHKMGTGKTKIVLDLAGELFLRDEIDGVLIVAPIGVHREWVNVDLKVNFALPYKRYICGDKESEDIDYACKDIIFLSCSIPSMSRKIGPELAREFLNHRRCLFVIDESIILKNPRTKFYKHVMGLRDLAPYRRILAGNPYPESFFDIWGQSKFLDPDIYDVGLSEFKETYGKVEKSFIKRNGVLKEIRRFVPNPLWVDRLKRGVKEWASFVGKKVLGLPEKMPPRTLLYKHSDAQKALSKAIQTTRLDQHEKLVGEVFDQNITIKIDSAMARIIRLQEINAGYIRDEEGKVWPLKSDQSPKHLILKELIQKIQENDPDEQIIIFCRFKPDVNQIEGCLRDMGKLKKRDYNLMVGGQDEVAREQIKHDFVARKFKILVLSIGVGARGLNLQTANHEIFWNNTYSGDQREQAEDRIHRSGQESPCYYYDIVAEDSIDEVILEAVRKKINLAQALTSDEKNIKKISDVRADWSELKKELTDALFN